jgi:hypothetical protein
MFSYYSNTEYLMHWSAKQGLSDTTKYHKNPDYLQPVVFAVL